MPSAWFRISDTETGQDERTHQIGIPHPNGILHADLAHQQAVHPPERELHELDVLGFQMRRQRSYIAELVIIQLRNIAPFRYARSMRATSSAMRLTLR